MTKMNPSLKLKNRGKMSKWDATAYLVSISLGPALIVIPGAYGKLGYAGGIITTVLTGIVVTYLTVRYLGP